VEIYILRHGIAELRRPGRPDRQRALTEDGKAKLRKVLARARKAEVAPSLILTSPYTRAVETAQMAAEVLAYKGEVVRTPALLPGASPPAAWAEIRSRPDERAVLLSGHEPLLSAIGAYLLNAPTLKIDLKKGALVRIDVEQLRGDPQGELKWLLTPKTA
jgi:phosphohistidine phosphatase